MYILRDRKYSLELLICALENDFPNIDDDNAVYVGVTNDLETRLRDHGIDENDVVGIYEAASRTIAMAAEKYLLDNHPNALGDTGGGKDDSVFIYAFNWIAGKHKK